MSDKGTCKKHGEFDLDKGCAQCIAERRLTGTDPNAWRTGEEEIRLEPEFVSVPEGEVIDGLTEEEQIYEAAIADRPEIALALRPGEDIEARDYFKEAMKLLEYAEGRVIATVENYKAANDDLSLISKLKKAMEGKKREYLDPLKAKAEAIRETYSSLMDPVFKADRITREKMLAYDAEQTRIRREQEEINRLREEATQKQKELTGEITEVETVELAPAAPERVSTAMGMTGQTDHWKYEVIDFALLPDTYKMVDTAQLNTIARSHHDKKLVPGVRFYNEPFITNRPR